MRSPAEVVVETLAPYLGPHTSRTALKTFSARVVHKTPELLTVADVPQLLAALRPMMRTLIGAEECELVVARVSSELGL